MPTRKIACLAIALSIAAGACGGRAAPQFGPNTAVAQPIALARPIQATPLFAAKVSAGIGPATMTRIEDIKGVVATGLRLRKLVVRSATGTARLRVAAVDPLGLRPLALPATRDAVFVWTALLSNEAVASYDAAKALHISGGAPIRFPQATTTSVGAFADTGVPNIADVLVSHQVGTKAGLKTTNFVEIGAAPGASSTEIRRHFLHILPGVRLHRLIAQPPQVLQPGDPQPFGVAQGSVIGTMHYLIEKNGFIRPDPAWVSAYIVNANVPLLGTVTCNRLMILQLAAARGEIERDGLGPLIDPTDYGGCYVPRFVDRNPSLPLSMHAFGLAIDLNVSQNPLGTAGHMDSRVVAIFEKWGFRWGGTFTTRPDPMHFEVARLVQP